MYQSKIEAAPFDLFDCYHSNSSLIKTGPRKATRAEAYAYADWLATKAGLPLLEKDNGVASYAHTIGDAVRYVVYGKCLSARDSLYQTGAYCIPMPGRNAHQDTVTMETLDESGAVIASQSFPVEPKKRGVIWDKAAIARAVGPVEKPAKARARRVAQQGAIRAIEMPAAAPVTPPADDTRDTLTQQVKQLAATVAKMQGHIDALLLHALEVPGASLPDAPPIGELAESMDATPIAVVTPWQGAKALHQARADHDAERMSAVRARRVRIVRAYLRMRAERNALRVQVYDHAVQLACAHVERDQARRDVARLKAVPHHMGNPVKMDDVQRLTRERDEARARLASTTEEAARLRKSVGQGADMLDTMTERALRAEIALKAIEGRAERGATPYRINGAAVTFAVAA